MIHPLVGVDVLRVARHRIGVVGTAQIGEKVQDIVREIADLRESARIGFGRRPPKRRVGKNDWERSGANRPDRGWSEVPLSIRAMDFEYVAPGYGWELVSSS